MKERITPCLWFDGKASEAGELYSSLFDDSKITNQSPVVTEVEISGQKLTLLDGGPSYSPNPSISLYYQSESEEEIKRIWRSFAADGSILMPIDSYPWSPLYGWVNDRYGVSWQLAVGKLEDVGQAITPTLMFVGEQFGRAEEAIDHYSTVFKDPGIDGILRYEKEESPADEGMIKHAQISLEGQKFMFMDSSLDHDFQFSEGLSLIIHCENQEEVDHYWNRLTEGGEEGRCGWLKDKFGVSWQVVPNILGKLMSDPQKAGKVAQAFMKMGKFDIDTLKKAGEE